MAGNGSGLMETVQATVLIRQAIILIAILSGSALLSASEVSFFSLSSSDFIVIRKRSKSKSLLIEKLHYEGEKLLKTILLANSIFIIAFVLVAVRTITNLAGTTYAQWWIYLTEIVAISAIIMTFGEIIPRRIGSSHKIAVALLMARPLNLASILLKPLTSVFTISSSFIRKRTSSPDRVMSLREISKALEMNNEALRDDGKILKGIVNFGNINASEIMSPRVDVTAFDSKSSFRQILPDIIESGFSRIPVFSGSIDNIMGILYVKDVLPFSNSTSVKWQSLLRPAYFVPETKKISELLKEFQQKKLHMAIVVDEFGATSGIITLEDILEEIVGEITDESDEDETLFKKIGEKTWLFEGKILLNDFYKILDIEGDPFSDTRGDAETLAGLILEITGEIPQKDRIIEHGNFRFRIMHSDKRRIKEIKVEITEPADES
jgi:gliding motility-associated protein GldE